MVTQDEAIRHQLKIIMLGAAISAGDLKQRLYLSLTSDKWHIRRKSVKRLSAHPFERFPQA
jgi:hypothetical protein